MKKILISIMVLALSCAMLCARGNRDMDIDTPVTTDSPAVTASPDPRDDVPMPENPAVTDGNVNDRDGIIDDEDSTDSQDSTNGTSGITDKNTAVTSPIPTATVNP